MKRRFKSVGPGVVSGASDINPTTVATVVVVGAGTTYGLAWLALLLLPMLGVVQVLATRVGLLSGQDLQAAVMAGYGRRAGLPLLASILVVNVLTAAADLQAGAAAVALLTGWNAAALVSPFAIVLLALLLFGKYDQVERVLKYVMLCLVAYVVAGVLAGPDWGAVLRGTLVPTIRLEPVYIAGALALLGTILQSYVYVWQTVEQVEESRPIRRLPIREWDAVVGAAVTGVLVWFILIASGATLGVHHQRVETAEQAAQALRPAAGSFASALFAIGLLTSAALALPIICASGGYVAAAYTGWPRGLSRRPRQALGFYAVIVAQVVLATAVSLSGIGAIRLLFLASLVSGIATPVGLVMLVMVVGNRDLMRQRPVGRALWLAGWLVVAVVTVATVVYLGQQLAGVIG